MFCMTVNLQKPDKSRSVNLQKGAQLALPGSFRVVDLMLGWEPSVSAPETARKNSSMFGLGGLINRAESAINTVTKSVDVDASCFEVDAQGKVINVVSFKNLSDRPNNIFHSGDNLTGKGEFPDETIHLKNLDNIDPRIQELHFWVNIFSGEADFGHIRECIAAVVDVQQNSEFCRFNLTGQFAGKSSILIGAISRNGPGWVYTAFGEAFNEKRIEDVIRNHY
jgi:stress response protein SCP2